MALAIFLAGQQSVASEDRPPFQVARQLQDALDESAVFERQSDEKRTQLLSQLAESTRGADVDWTDRRNRNALAFYLLTGGDPRAVRSAVNALKDGDPHKSVVQSALAYARGEDLSKDRDFETIDPRDVSSELGGVFALAQARLLIDRDRARAKEKFLAARMSMITEPGPQFCIQ